MGKKKSSQSTELTIAEAVKKYFSDVEFIKEGTDEVVFKKNSKTVKIFRIFFSRQIINHDNLNCTI